MRGAIFPVVFTISMLMQNPSEVQDIFGDLSNEVPAAPSSAASPISSSSVSSPVAPTTFPAASSSGPGGMNPRLIIIGAGVVVALIAVIGIVVYMMGNTAKQAPVATPDTTTPAPTEVTPSPAVPVQGSNSQPTPEPVTPAPATTPQPSPSQDTDGDGLTDEEEGRAGTDQNRVDTDGDRLSDREEVRVYGTDPLNADTDGDGYLDGDEVRSGYNPGGAGKLLVIPTELQPASKTQ